MGDKSKIEWTTSSWNPLVGCTKVSQGCKNCYAMTMAARIANAAQAALREGKTLTDVQAAYRKVVRWTRGGVSAADIYDVALPQWNNRVEMIESLLTLPLKWKRARRVFVNSMSDLFHESVPFDFVDRVFAMMALCPQHTFQVLTKRPERMAEYLNWTELHRRDMPRDRVDCIGMAMSEIESKEWSGSRGVPGWGPDRVPGVEGGCLPNVWLGTSCEDQVTADVRIPHLLRCPAAVRFLSCEPLIGELKILGRLMGGESPGECSNCGVGHGYTRCPNTGGVSKYQDHQEPHCSDFKRKNFAIHWVIVGGESGHGARPCVIGHIRRIVKDCQAAGVSVFVKQLGVKPVNREGEAHPITDHHDIDQFPEDLRVRQFPGVVA